MHDSLYFIGVLVFIFIVWVATGGPTHPLAFGGPLLSGPGPLGGGTYLELPRAVSIGNVGVGESRASGGGIRDIKQELQNADRELDRLQKKVAETIAFGPPSPYRGQVVLSRGVSGAGNTNPSQEYITITLSSSARQSLNISGWTLRSEVTGKSAVIPQGTEVPTSGAINPIEPVILHPGDRATIASGRSPIGASFRENKCIGYFSQFQKFSPTLPNTCPLPRDEIKEFYGPNLVRDPVCSEYAEKLSRCTLAASVPPHLSSTCQYTLTTYVNYNGCVSAHRNDPNFKGTNWRVYLGRDSAMWRSTREVVKLIDTTGQTVDMFSY